MDEISNILRDLRSGALPAEEIPGYLRWMAWTLCRALGKFSLALVFGFLLAWLIAGR